MTSIQMKISKVTVSYLQSDLDLASASVKKQQLLVKRFRKTLFFINVTVDIQKSIVFAPSFHEIVIWEAGLLKKELWATIIAIVLVAIIVEGKKSAKNIIVNSVNYCAGRLMQEIDNVVCWRLFSQAKYYLNSYRKSILPIHLESQLFLMANEKFWDVNLVNKIA